MPLPTVNCGSAPPYREGSVPPYREGSVPPYREGSVPLPTVNCGVSHPRYPNSAPSPGEQYTAPHGIMRFIPHPAAYQHPTPGERYTNRFPSDGNLRGYPTPNPSCISIAPPPGGTIHGPHGIMRDIPPPIHPPDTPSVPLPGERYAILLQCNRIMRSNTPSLRLPSRWDSPDWDPTNGKPPGYPTPDTPSVPPPRDEMCIFTSAPTVTGELFGQ